MTALSTSSDSEWLRNLIPHFMEQTKDRLAQIEVHRQAIHNGSDAMVAMKAICDIAHKISGTADTFGFGNLGAVAQNVEAVWSNSSQSGDDPMVILSRMELAIPPLIKEIATLLEPT